MSFADDVRSDWSRDIMAEVGGDGLLAAHPPDSPGREAVIAAGLAALTECDTDIVGVGIKRGAWPMSADGWPHAAGHETSSTVRWAHVRAAMRTAAGALAEA